MLRLASSSPQLSADAKGITARFQILGRLQLDWGEIRALGPLGSPWAPGLGINVTPEVTARIWDAIGPVQKAYCLLYQGHLRRHNVLLVPNAYLPYRGDIVAENIELLFGAELRMHQPQ